MTCRASSTPRLEADGCKTPTTAVPECPRVRVLDSEATKRMLASLYRTLQRRLLTLLQAVSLKAKRFTGTTKPLTWITVRGLESAAATKRSPSALPTSTKVVLHPCSGLAHSRCKAEDFAKDLHLCLECSLRGMHPASSECINCFQHPTTCEDKKAEVFQSVTLQRLQTLPWRGERASHVCVACLCYFHLTRRCRDAAMPNTAGAAGNLARSASGLDGWKLGKKYDSAPHTDSHSHQPTGKSALCSCTGTTGPVMLNPPRVPAQQNILQGKVVELAPCRNHV